MKRCLLLLLILLNFVCFSQTNGPVKKSSIVSWYIIPANQSTRAPKASEYLEVDYRMSIGSNDSLLNETFSTGEHVTLPVNHPSFKSVFMQVREGDRLEIVVNADSFYRYTIRRPLPAFVKSGDSIRFYMKVYEILNDETLMQKQMAKDNEQIEYDSARFNQYINSYRNVQKTERGLHYMITRQGNGAQPKSGDSVTINYRGYFMDGKVFDRDDDGYSFIAGLGQVVPGLDEAVLLMKTGTKMKLFIPYYLAYGAEGTNLIPGYSSLIFDVELISVKTNNY